jgi:hypothetical protein
MRAYVIATGSLWALIAVVHVWRVMVEPHLASHLWYLVLTLAAVALAVWAWRVLRQGRA